MLMTWEMINQKCQMKTIRDVQEEIGFIKNRENGIIEQAVQQTEISELLMPYARKADFVLTFQLGYRSVLNMFLNSGQILTDDIITAITMALDSNSYNLETILCTLNLEYNPIENMSITEQIVTTSTINAHMIYDKVSTSKNIGEIQKTDTDTLENGAQKEKHTENITDAKGTFTETNTETQNLGKVDNAIHTLLTVGAQANITNSVQKHAPYNANEYSPRDKTDNTENIGERIDETNTTDQTNPITNTITNNINIPTHTDTIDRDITKTKENYTDIRTTHSTQNPYNETETINERNDKQDRNQNDNKNRTLKGVQGISTQDLILKQRELANVNVVKSICDIVINTIANGFITAY